MYLIAEFCAVNNSFAFFPVPFHKPQLKRPKV